MYLQQQNINNTKPQINGELLEKVILGNDLSGLNPLQKVEYIKNLCNTLNLNITTKPIQLMKFQGREVPYFTKDASEQLRKNNRVSISKMDTRLHDGGLYVVTAYATTPDGRQDCSTGAIVISGLKGDALANAMMKCETKAKRRVTLSICGLGFIDETEVDSLQNAQKIDINELEKSNVAVFPQHIQQIKPDTSFLLSKTISELEQAKNLNELKETFESAKKHGFGPEELSQINAIKDIRKSELIMMDEDYMVDAETGEIQ